MEQTRHCMVSKWTCSSVGYMLCIVPVFPRSLTARRGQESDVDTFRKDQASRRNHLGGLGR